MRYAEEDEEEPPQLKRLRLLVTVLTIVLILGIVTIAATIVIRLGFGGMQSVPVGVLAEALSLPADHQIVATGQGPGTVHVVLQAPSGVQALHIYDAGTGSLLSKTQLTRD